MADDSVETDDRLDWRRRGLSPRSRRVMLAIAEAMLADDEAGELAPGSAEACARGVERLDLAVGASSADLRRGFGVLTFVVQLLPVFLIGVFARMTSLSLERRIAYLEALESSRVGLLAMLFVALKVPLCIPAFEDPVLLASTGFDRPSTTSRRRLAVAPRAPRDERDAP